MGCGCEGQKLTTPRKANIQFCDECDPCEANKSNVKLCAYVVPTLEEGRYYTNSFIFVEEDDSVYYISDDRSEIPFGSRPKYIDNFDPDDVANQFKNTMVFDLANKAAYIYGKDGERVSFALTDTPIVSIKEGEGIKVTASDGEYTIAIREDKLANIDSIPDLAKKADESAKEIKELKPVVEGHTSKLTELEPKVKEAGDNAISALGLAGTADEEAKAAQAQITGLASSKQNKLQAGEGISIADDVISATATSYKPAADTNGLMTSTDRDTMKGGVVSKVEGQAAGDIFLVSVTTKKSNDDGTEYTEAVADFSIPTATATAAGMLSPTTYNQIATNTSDIADLKEIKYAKSLDLTMDESNYKITLKLNDQDGTALSTKTIDLPLESVVVGGKYDKATKEVVLTLKNGEEVKFSVADLVSGLQTEITAENKLPATLVQLSEGDSYLTAEEKEKLDGLSDETVFVAAGNISQRGQFIAHEDDVLFSVRTVNLKVQSWGLNSTYGTIPAATTTKAGVMTAADKTKLDNMAEVTEADKTRWDAAAGDTTGLENRLATAEGTIKTNTSAIEANTSAIESNTSAIATKQNKLKASPTVTIAEDGTIAVGSTVATDAEVDTKVTNALKSYTTTTDMNTALGKKQDKLTQGTGIKIEGNTISATAEVAEYTDAEWKALGF